MDLTTMLILGGAAYFLFRKDPRIAQLKDGATALAAQANALESTQPTVAANMRMQAMAMWSQAEALAKGGK